MWHANNAGTVGADGCVVAVVARCAAGILLGPSPQDLYTQAAINVEGEGEE